MRTLFLLAMASTTSAFAAPALETEVALPPASSALKVQASRYLTPPSKMKKALKLCTSGTDSVIAASRFAAVQIDMDSVSFAGKDVVKLEGGWLSKADREAETVESLGAQLAAAVDVQSKVREAGCEVGSPGELLLIVDRHVPTETLVAVTHTAGTAGFRHLAIAVDASTSDAPAWSPAAQDGWEVWPREEVEDGDYAEGMVWLKVLKSGLVIVGEHETMPRSMIDAPMGCPKSPCKRDVDYSWGDLESVMGSLQQNFGASGVIGVLPHPGATTDVVVQALSASSGFSRVVLASAGVDTDPGRRQALIVQPAVERTITPPDELGVLVVSLPEDIEVEQVPRFPRVGYISSRLWASRMAEYIPDARICYLRGLDRNPGVSGDLTVSFTVQGDGTPKDVKTIEDTVNDEPTTTCFSEMFTNMRFPAPHDRGALNGRYTYSLTTDMSDMTELSHDRARRVRIRLMPPEDLTALVKERREALMACTESRKEGIVGFDVAVDQYGRVSEALVTGSHLASPDEEACIGRSLFQAKYTGTHSVVYHAGLIWPSMEPSAPLPDQEEAAEAQ